MRIVPLATIFGATLIASEVQAQSSDYAFENVTVLPMDSERVLTRQTVLISGDRILFVGPSSSIEVADGTTRIDGSGKYLMPGLAEMHGHLPSGQWPAALVDRLLFLNIANGVTTVRGMQGNPAQFLIRSQIASGERIGPRLILGSPALSGNSASNPSIGADLVRRYHEAGYDLLKVHEGLSAASFDSIAAVAGELEIPFGGHIADAVGLGHSIDGGIGTVEHLDGFIEELQGENGPPNVPAGFFGLNWAGTVDYDKIRPLAARLAAADGWVTPTQTLFVNFLSDKTPAQLRADPRLGTAFWPNNFVDQWSNQISNFRSGMDPVNASTMLELRAIILEAIVSEGGGILLGADAPQIFNVPGFATVYEAENLVAAGLSEYDVLTAGTRGPAIYLGEEEGFGTVAPRMRADLILLNSNPLENITNLRDRAGVMAAGRWFPIEEIETRLAQLSQ